MKAWLLPCPSIPSYLMKWHFPFCNGCNNQANLEAPQNTDLPSISAQLTKNGGNLGFQVSFYTMSCSYPHSFYKITYIKCESDINQQKAYPQLSSHYPQIFPAHQNGDDSSWSSCYPHVTSISKF